MSTSLRPPFWMDAAGFDPAGGGDRLARKNHLHSGGPGMKILRAASSLLLVFALYLFKEMHIDTKSVLASNAAGTLTAVCHDVGSRAPQSFEKSP